MVNASLDGHQGEKPRDSCSSFLKRAGGPVCGEGHGGASCGDRIATFIMYLKYKINIKRA